jgi:hypothetical protein
MEQLHQQRVLLSFRHQLALQDVMWKHQFRLGKEELL